MLDTITQYWIFIFGVSAITLVSFKIRFGFILGIVSQPDLISWIIGTWKWYHMGDKICLSLFKSKNMVK